MAKANAPVAVEVQDAGGAHCVHPFAVLRPCWAQLEPLRPCPTLEKTLVIAPDEPKSFSFLIQFARTDETDLLDMVRGHAHMKSVDRIQVHS